MSDFSAEVGQDSIQAGTKILLEIFKYLSNLSEKLYEIYLKNASPEMRAHKENLKLIKGDIQQREYAQKIEGMKGYVDYAKLKRSGLPLAHTGVSMEGRDFTRLKEICDRNGVVISGLKDARTDFNGKSTYMVVCLEKDASRLKQFLETIAEEKTVQAAMKERFGITHVVTNGIATARPFEEFTPTERARVEELDKVVRAIRRNDANLHNDFQSDRVRDAAVNGFSDKSCSFDRSINRFTGRELDKGVDKIIVDMRDPQKYIRAKSYNDEYAGKIYTKTEYDVYNGSDHIGTWDDGRFDNRPHGYWESIKTDMKDKGGFSDNVLIFNSEKEYGQYKGRFIEGCEKDLAGIKIGGESRDYGKIKQTLIGQLSDIGYEYEPPSNAFKEPVAGHGDRPQSTLYKVDRGTGEHMATVASQKDPYYIKALTIQSQLDCYGRLQRIDSEKAVAYANLAFCEKGTPGYSAAKENYNSVVKSEEALLQTENNLYGQRKDIEAVIAEQDMRENSLDRASEKAAVRDKADGHDERVSDESRGERMMDSWRGKIQDHRSGAGAMSANQTQPETVLDVLARAASRTPAGR